MKIFQIFNSQGTTDLFCHYDMTHQFTTLESTVGKFASDIMIVEAPDYVFEGWGYDATAEGDARFIQPPLPEPSKWTGADGTLYQWVYDTETGTFYIGDYDGKPLTAEEAQRAIAALYEVST